MKVLTNNSTPLRTLRLSICMSLLSVILIACTSDGSDGKDKTPLNNPDTTDTEGTTTSPIIEGTTTSPIIEGTTTSPVIEGTTTSPVIEGTTTSPIMDPPQGTVLSCSGSRLWGPVVEDGRTFYVSEANGRSEADFPGCRTVWIYDATQNCSDIFSISDTTITQITATGDLYVQRSDEPDLTMQPADISVDALQSLSDCPEGSTDTGDTTTGEPLSCSGTRVWGPILESGFSYYFSEAGGLQDNINCAVVWGYAPDEDCQVLVTEEAREDFEGISFEIAADGTLNLVGSAGTNNLPVAGISYTDLAQTTECK